MSFEVINNSNNALQLSDGKILAPVGADGSKRELQEVSSRDKNFEKRGWISIIEKEEPKQAAPTPTTAEATKTEAKK